MKAIFLLVTTNIAVMAMIGIIVKVLGLDPVLAENGLNLTSLFIISAVMGFAGSFISLFMSKTMAKRGMGVQIIEHPQNETEAWIYNTVWACKLLNTHKTKPKRGFIIPLNVCRASWGLKCQK